MLSGGAPQLFQAQSPEVLLAHRGDFRHFAKRPRPGEIGLDGLPQAPQPGVSMGGLRESGYVAVDELDPQMALRHRGFVFRCLGVQALHAVEQCGGGVGPFHWRFGGHQRIPARCLYVADPAEFPDRLPPDGSDRVGGEGRQQAGLVRPHFNPAPIHHHLATAGKAREHEGAGLEKAHHEERENGVHHARMGDVFVLQLGAFRVGVQPTPAILTGTLHRKVGAIAKLVGFVQPF